jgi:UDP-glucose 4-epimerase
MKIMLLGGAGFIGLNLANVLVRHGHVVYIADRVDMPMDSTASLPEIAGYFMIKVDNTAQILETMDELCIDCVIGLTSSLIPSSTLSQFEHELSQVISPMFRLLDHLARRGINFVYLSSGGTVYGVNDKPQVSEIEPLRPINYYGYSKVLFEQYLAFVGQTQQLRYLILRPSNPFGPYQCPSRKQGLIAVAVDKVQQGLPIEVWGDGSVVRDYIWVGDLAEAIAALLHKNEAWGNVFNVGSGHGHSVNTLLKLIGELTGNQVTIQYREARSVDAPRLVLDISRLRATIAFQPSDLRTALALYLNQLETK